MSEVKPVTAEQLIGHLYREPADIKPPTLDELKALALAAIPGPWRECGHDLGGCTCGMVWSVPADAPVGQATIGEWGDTWPALRFVDGESMGARVEPYLEKMVYGSIGEKLGMSTAAFIAAANPATVLALIAEIEELRKAKP